MLPEVVLARQLGERRQHVFHEAKNERLERAFHGKDVVLGIRTRDLDGFRRALPLATSEWDVLEPEPALRIAPHLHAGAVTFAGPEASKHERAELGFEHLEVLEEVPQDLPPLVEW
ncbi:MAG: hypothetical protein U0610_33500 [bacterium]